MQKWGCKKVQNIKFGIIIPRKIRIVLLRFTGNLKFFIDAGFAERGFFAFLLGMEAGWRGISIRDFRGKAEPAVIIAESIFRADPFQDALCIQQAVSMVLFRVLAGGNRTADDTVLCTTTTL